MAARARSVASLAVLFAIVLGTTASLAAATGELFFTPRGATAPIGATPVVHGTRQPVDLVLHLRMTSPEDWNRLPPLAAKGPNPTVRVEVMEFRGGKAYLPTSFILDPLEPSEIVDNRTQTLRLRFLLGRSQMFYFLADHFGHLGLISDKNWEGTYRITAFYGDVSSPPIFVTIR